MTTPLPFDVLDSHVHFWNPGPLHYPWLAEAPAISAPHLPADYWREADAVPVRQLIFVEAGCAPGHAMREAEWVGELAAHDPRIAAIVAHVPMDAGAETGRQLDLLAAQPLVRGIRHNIQAEPDPEFCLRPAFVEGVRRLAGCGYPFDVCIYHHQLAAVIRLVDQCPDVRFVLDHLGKPGIRAGLLEPWQAELAELAARPNVWCKLSGLLTEADWQNWQPADLQPYLAHALNVFGVDRVLYGSDWPVCHLAGSIRDWVSAAHQAASPLGEPALEKIFAKNARSCYGLSQA
jgi:L-fuconolactonase